MWEWKKYDVCVMAKENFSEINLLMDNFNMNNDSD